MCARHGHVLTGESPERGRQWQPHSQEQGACCEARAESKERTLTGPGNGSRRTKVALESTVCPSRTSTTTS